MYGRRGKFGTSTAKKDKPTEDGYTFDSLKEHQRYRQLKIMFNAGEIWGLQVHGDFPRYPLVVNGVKVSSYGPDFIYCMKDGTVVYEDVKSNPTKTRDYVMRKKLMKACHGIEITEWPKKAKNPAQSK